LDFDSETPERALKTLAIVHYLKTISYPSSYPVVLHFAS
jgi:hypothetical protein